MWIYGHLTWMSQWQLNNPDDKRKTSVDSIKNYWYNQNQTTQNKQVHILWDMWHTRHYDLHSENPLFESMNYLSII